ncbi:NAD-dependent epimerase/dehydratase family protein [bacterium]|nr:NAD-dependent epimerase/dehydratase family protein [bacterium]
MAHYLVTGGAGFVGGHLCDVLLAAGHAVRVVDDLSTGRAENLAADVELLKGDVRDAALMARALRDVDGVFHLAAIAAVGQCNQQLFDSHTVNLGAWVQLLELVKANPVPLIVMSSAAVYGEQRVMPIVETAVTEPINPYGADKLGCELHGRAAAEVHGLDVRAFRAFNIYGPRQQPGSAYSGVISIFMDAIGREQPITFFGDGEQTRDFVYVGDVVKVLMAAIQQGWEGFERYNICTGAVTTVNQLAGHLERIIGHEVEHRQVDARAGDIRHSQGSPAALKAVLGLAPETPVAEGLQRTWEWYRNGR